MEIHNLFERKKTEKDVTSGGDKSSKAGEILQNQKKWPHRNK